MQTLKTPTEIVEEVRKRHSHIGLYGQTLHALKDSTDSIFRHIRELRLDQASF